MEQLHSDLQMLIKARRLYISNKIDTKNLNTMIEQTLDLIIQGGIK